MRSFALAIAFAAISGHAGAQTSVATVAGNIVVTRSGQTAQITSAGLDFDPAVSPNQRYIAFVRVEARATQEGNPDLTSLALYDLEANEVTILAGPYSSNAPPRSFRNPTFSLDGGYVYVEANAWTTSNSIHQINIGAKTSRFVTDGNDLRILRTGRYRGYLLVWKHQYNPGPAFGSFEAAFIVRPDAQEIFEVPGSRDNPDGLQAWLTNNSYEAW